MRAVNKASWALISTSFICWTYTRMFRYSSLDGVSQIMDHGSRPEFKKKGENPVDSDHTRLMANSMAGSCGTQSF